MMYLLYGFVAGFFVPYIARRFNKFMPATLGYAVYKILMPVKRCKKTSLKKQALLRKYFYRSVGIGILTALLFYVFYLKFGQVAIFYKLLFVWACVLLAEIDKRMFLLPDIITFPLVLVGFFVSLASFGFVGPINASVAGLLGYFIPVVASLFFVWRNKDAFGGGDIKYLSVIGVWCGVSCLLFTIMLASISFGIYSIIKKQRSGAFGPWLSYSTILILILFN